MPKRTKKRGSQTSLPYAPNIDMRRGSMISLWSLWTDLFHGHLFKPPRIAPTSNPIPTRQNNLIQTMVESNQSPGDEPYHSEDIPKDLDLHLPNMSRNIYRRRLSPSAMPLPLMDITGLDLTMFNDKERIDMATRLGLAVESDQHMKQLSHMMSPTASTERKRRSLSLPKRKGKKDQARKIQKYLMKNRHKDKLHLSDINHNLKDLIDSNEASPSSDDIRQLPQNGPRKLDKAHKQPLTVDNAMNLATSNNQRENIVKESRTIMQTPPQSALNDKASRDQNGSKEVYTQVKAMNTSIDRATQNVIDQAGSKPSIGSSVILSRDVAVVTTSSSRRQSTHQYPMHPPPSYKQSEVDQVPASMKLDSVISMNPARPLPNPIARRNHETKRDSIGPAIPMNKAAVHELLLASLQGRIRAVSQEAILPIDLI